MFVVVQGKTNRQALVGGPFRTEAGHTPMSPLLGAGPGCWFVPLEIRFVHLRSREVHPSSPSSRLIHSSILIRKGDFGVVNRVASKASYLLGRPLSHQYLTWLR